MPLWLVLELKPFAWSGDAPAHVSGGSSASKSPAIQLLKAFREGALGEGTLPESLVPQKSKWL